MAYNLDRPMPDSDLRLLTAREVAELLRVTPRQLLAFCRSGELSYVDVGRGRKKLRRMFEPADVEKFIARRKRTDQWRKESTGGRTRRTGGTSSSTAVVDFVALHKQRQNEKRGASLPKPGTPPHKK